MTRTREPCWARAAARLTAVVVLPTPPFWLAIVITRQEPGRGHTRSGRFAPAGLPLAACPASVSASGCLAAGTTNSCLPPPVATPAPASPAPSSPVARFAACSADPYLAGLRPGHLGLPGPRAGWAPGIRPRARLPAPRFPRPIARRLSGAFSCPPRFHRHSHRPRPGPEPVLHVKLRPPASPGPEPRTAAVPPRPQRHPRSQLRLRLAIPGPLRKPPRRSSPCPMSARSGPATGQRPSARLSRPDRPYRPRPAQRPRPAYPAGAILAGPGRPPRRRSLP